MARPLRIVEIEPSTVTEDAPLREGIYSFTIELNDREAAALTTEATEIKIGGVPVAGTVPEVLKA